MIIHATSGVSSRKWAAIALGLVHVGLALAGAEEGAVLESGRRIPVAYEADVLVVGGSSGAVAAAVAAADGARVFLAAPRPYLGEDMCATLRLWLEEGEVPAAPLARRLFAPGAARSGGVRAAGARSPGALPFSYAASLPSATPHLDAAPPALLTDGVWGRAETQSVQYNGDVAITADLGTRQEVGQFRVVLYYRAGGDFNPRRVTVATSDDGSAWTELVSADCGEPDDGVIVVTGRVGRACRYARFQLERGAGASRILVGEIELIAAGAEAPDAAAAAAAPEFSRLARPMHVKRVLDDALLETGVTFLYGCFATDVLRDEDGRLCGIVMANRAGRQAVLARVIIDATPRATVARMAGARFAAYPRGPQQFRRVVIGGEPVPVAEGSCRAVGLAFEARPAAAGNSAAAAATTIAAPLYEYTLELSLADASFAAFAAAEQRARDMTFHPAQLDAAEALFAVPPDPVRAVRAYAGAADADLAAIDLAAFRPAGVEHLYLLGGCADVPPAVAARLLRPLALIDLGTRLGRAAADEARQVRPARAPRVSPPAAASSGPTLELSRAEVREVLVGVRPAAPAAAEVPSPARLVPVLGRYDLVVIGGGTAGAPAGIGAARAGARTLLIEFLHGLGGVGTLGRISSYYHGYRGGFTAQVDAGIAELGAGNFVVGKTEWWRRANREAGTELWFGVLGCGAVVEAGAVKGAVVATPHGRGIVLARTVIDATGNADIAAAAGAECETTAADDVAVQGAGLPPLSLGDGYTNTDWTFADDTDVVDAWHHFVTARRKFADAHDLGQLVDTRERRRVVGDVTISPMDIILSRMWPDSINIAQSNFDTHGFTVHPIFHVMPPDRAGLTAFVPLRALLPRGLDGILVTGLGVSAHRDAMPVIRMQPDVQNQGYACGMAAALAARAGTTIRQLDVRALQRELVAAGCLPDSVLREQGGWPMANDKIAQAVADLMRAPEGTAPDSIDSALKDRAALAVVFAHPAAALPMVEAAYTAAAGVARLGYAQVLALLGSAAGADALLERVDGAAAFDKGWDYTGMGQFGRSESELDACIVALGVTRDPRALDAIVRKVELLDATAEFSHHRACAMALERLGDPRAAPALAALLAKPGMTGHAATTVEEAIGQTGPSRTETAPRNESLRELILARALYRCGDWNGAGAAVLRRYAEDLRGHYARHARAVLGE